MPPPSSPTPPPHPHSPGKLLILNGFPGTGKLTILTKLKDHLPVATTCLLDNHLLIDPVEAVLPGRSPAHHALRRQVRDPIFAHLARRVREGHTVLMTACLVEDNDTDRGVLQEYLDIVRGGGTLFWVSARCDAETLERRVGSVERVQGGRAKLTDWRVLRELVRVHRLIEPGGSAGEGVRVVEEELDASRSVDCSVGFLLGVLGLLGSGG
ncbi:hypothetical protein C7974DRAFT_352523 [Boeremia exigua]|uniref:uncharacterized protein n=1 Tax=Boeremia exigua TaxID=749465 RepID=UPI001E8EDEF5|nr:uncharacterized protein C7974DRAFT_352523 [Boeremia exigua]KAH6643207.1 hypothetical protein C7974DRAFT_352523 [Boeremia exigua]